MSTTDTFWSCSIDSERETDFVDFYNDCLSFLRSNDFHFIAALPHTNHKISPHFIASMSTQGAVMVSTDLLFIVNVAVFVAVNQRRINAQLRGIVRHDANQGLIAFIRQAVTHQRNIKANAQ